MENNKTNKHSNESINYNINNSTANRIRARRAEYNQKNANVKVNSDSSINSNKNNFDTLEISTAGVLKFAIVTSIVSSIIGYNATKQLLEIPKPEPTPIHRVKSVF